MISDKLAIKVDGISKCYRIGIKEKMHDSLAGCLFDYLRRPLTNYQKYRSLYDFSDARDSRSNAPDILWALDGVSFEVGRGEVLGVIGQNGAGKSTLLKVLCKIIEPTAGRAEIRGRVSSLLEVGTGFHPELTGRENIYLNATIMGMKKKEVDRKFDDIVEFSGIGRFIDTPVKRFSSGMAVRLAFSVAAYLEPEIMIVDEVLAVGDAEFQRKCIGRMEREAGRGRTILLVSHNIGAITSLCGRAIWLEKGKVRQEGKAPTVVAGYLAANAENGSSWKNQSARAEGEVVEMMSASIISAEGCPTGVVEFNKPFSIELEYALNSEVRNLCLICRATDCFGNVIWTSWDTDADERNKGLRKKGRYLAKCNVPGAVMRPGHYYISVGAMIPGERSHGFHHNVVSFDVSEMGYRMNANRIGVITPIFDWETKRDDRDSEQDGTEVYRSPEESLQRAEG
jgi:lipopolysaccharide transport system ATP-binding protein